MRNRVLIEKFNFHVDEVNKIVVCKLECDMQLHKHPAWNAIDSRMFKSIPYVSWDGKFIVKAKARCNATDTFDVETGKRIAESKAKVKMFNTAWKVYRMCEDALVDLAQECQRYSQACVKAMDIENNHVLELTK